MSKLKTKIKWVGGWRSNCVSQRGKSAEQRFHEKVDKSGDCWLWKGCADKDGYGFIRIDGKNIKAHRFALSLKIGKPLEKGELACHSCDTPRCVNPDHLWVGDNSKNQIDSAAKGRSPRQILRLEDVRRIREASLFGARAIDLANAYGVSASTISSIRSGVKWVGV